MAAQQTAQSSPGPASTAAPGATDEQVLAFLDGLEALAERPAVAGLSHSALISLLQGVQDRFGYLPPKALEELALRLRMPLARVYGVVSFYAQFYTEPRGRHTVRCCRGTACHVKGAGGIIEAVCRELGIEDGQTTPDRVYTLETVACLGTCFLAPVLMIDTTYYGNLVPEDVASILADYRGRAS